MTRADVSGTPVATTPQKNQIVLPIPDEHFKDFIKGLLGSPQSLIKRIRGSFDMNRVRLQQINDILLQRICQQNGCLLQVEARLGLSDDTVVTFESFEGLLAYNAPRKVASSTLDISWDFLVGFSDKPNPEKQRVQLHIHSHSATDRDHDVTYSGHSRLGVWFAVPMLFFKIEYTARTWGDDIESLLTRYLDSITQRPAGIRRILISHSEKISLALALLFYASVIYGCFTATSRFSQENVSRVQSVIDSYSSTDLAVLGKELALLLTMHAEGAWVNHILTISVILVLAVPLAIILAVWTSEVSYSPKPSFISLTTEDDEVRSEQLKAHARRSGWYIASVLSNIGCSVLANVLFRAFF